MEISFILDPRLVDFIAHVSSGCAQSLMMSTLSISKNKKKYTSKSKYWILLIEYSYLKYVSKVTTIFEILFLLF